MARKPANKKPAKKPAARPSTWTEVPVWNYPRAPHILGIDWFELAVRDPASTAAIYEAIGFQLRGQIRRGPVIAVGGKMIVLRPSAIDDQTLAPGRLVLQVAVDDIAAQRQRMLDLRLAPGPIRRQARGDAAFLWTDADGLQIRFVGPRRKPATLRK
ncbi:MAG: hypothetical protein NTW19_00805 [Planctomycetota bacterium]|nr:hypothetical protein [Planctomycetota bacterium]